MLLPHSKCHIFVGFDDGPKAIRYYNAETQKVLTSCNFHFLNNLPVTPSAPELILIDPAPAVPCEGECARCGDNVTQQPGTMQLANIELGDIQSGNKRMREGPEEMDDEPRWINYYKPQHQSTTIS